MTPDGRTTLDVAIATWQPAGIRRVAAMNLPRINGVRYVISWQCHGGEASPVPDALMERADVLVDRFDGTGVSANRNNALLHCEADVILMADDDLRYQPKDLEHVIATFEVHPQLQVAAFRYRGSRKTYPTEAVALKRRLPKNYSCTTFELAVRREVTEKVRFNERFGPGAPVWQAGEDERFLYDARRAGLNVMFFPVDITEHYHPTTGSRPMTTAGICAASGKIVRMEFPWSWLMRIVLKSWREKKRGGRMWFSLYHQLRGALSDGF